MNGRNRRAIDRGLVVLVALGSVTGCSITVNAPQPPETTPLPSQTAPLTSRVDSTPSASLSPTPSAEPVPAATVTVTQVAAASSTPRQITTEATLSMGETAHLANWDVTVLRGEHGKDEISYGWKVNVCYVAASELAESGRIRVSDKPWSAILQDLEGGENPVEVVPIRDFERDHAYRPDYVDTTLGLGECNLGWIGIVHGSPDLGWYGITYEPSTGESVTWLG